MVLDIANGRDNETRFILACFAVSFPVMRLILGAIMPLLDWREVVRKDFPELGPITAATRRRVRRNRHRFRGSVRVFTGRIWETDAYNRRRTKVLNTPLP